MNPAQAAALWDRVERALIRHGLIRDGRDLREQRAAMVRVVGGGAVDATPSLPPIKLDDSAPQQERRPGRSKLVYSKARRTIVTVPTGPAPGPSSATDSAVTAMLDRMLAQSCGRRVGYDGDDEVGYR